MKVEAKLSGEKLHVKLFRSEYSQKFKYKFQYFGMYDIDFTIYLQRGNRSVSYKFETYEVITFDIYRPNSRVLDINLINDILIYIFDKKFKNSKEFHNGLSKLLFYFVNGYFLDHYQDI